MNRKLTNQTLQLGGRDFTILEVIGTGASCVVYRAVCPDQTEHLLKEYNPKHIEMYRSESGELCLESEEDRTEFEAGLVRFREGHAKQRELRLDSDLKNSTSNVQQIYCANGTEYIDMTCFAGRSYEKVQEKSVYDLLRRIKAVAQVIGNYHRAGLLHLDIKPQNIFTLPETCELVMLFDFDSVTSKNDAAIGKARSYTLSWAAPEQINPLKRRSICEATDIFALGEIIFYQLTGRHSNTEERRSFSDYSLDHTLPIFKNVNPKVFPMLTDLLHHTICGAVKQRYQSTNELISKLDEIIKIADPKEPYLKSSAYTMQDFFVGRDAEIREIHEKLSENRVLFLSGIGGIGKSELAKRYAHTYCSEYETVIFAPYVNDVNMLIQSDEAISIYNFAPYPAETSEDYCARKLKKLQQLCGDRTLFIVDNLDRDDDPDISKLLELGCKMLITTRMDFSKYGLGLQLPLDALHNRENIRKIFDKHYTKPLAQEDNTYIDQIIDLIAGHTMTVELLAKQMMAGRVKPKQMLAMLQEGGISESGKEKVHSGKDGKLSMQNAYGHIQTLFNLSELNKDELYILANLSLIPHTGIPTELFHDWCGLKDYEVINRLVNEGWLRLDKEKDYLSLHPLISEISINSCQKPTLWSFMLDNYANSLSSWVSLPFSHKDALRLCAYKFVSTFIKKKYVDESIVHVLWNIAQFFCQNLYDHESALNAIASASELISNIPSFDIETTLKIKCDYAIICDNIGELRQDQQWHGTAISIYLDILHCDQLAVMAQDYKAVLHQNIACAYDNYGDLDNAIKHFSHAIELRKALILEDDSKENNSELSLMYNNIGIMYRRQGNYNIAIEYYEKALAISLKYGEESERVAKLYHDIGRALLDSNKSTLETAEKYAIDSLVMRERIWGEESYYLAMSRFLLGEIYALNKSSTYHLRALDLLEKAKCVFVRTLGRTHKDTQRILQAIACVKETLPSAD